MSKGWYFMAQDKALPTGPFVTKEAAERAAAGITLAFDRASVRTIDADGRLHVAVNNISKANVCPYLGEEISDFEALGLQAKKIYQLLRSPEELEKAAPTFNNIPLLSKHVPINVDDPKQDLVIGSTGTDAQFTAPYLRNSLVVWVREAIEAIDKEEQKELSCAYRYRADMTPGTFMGVNYDGVMRDIIGNHVALVIEGRAGSDVVVGDAANQEIKMSKPLVLSRRGVATLGALVAYLKPKLAQDSAFPNLYPVLTGITTKNFKDKKAEIVAGIKKDSKLAKDANLDDLTNLLDALEGTEVMEGADADPNSGLPMAKKEMDEKALDADPIAKLKAFLKGKVSDADLAAIDKIMGEGKAADEPPATTGAPKDPAKDADLDKDKKDMVTKPAMDAAIAAATKKATEDAQRSAKDLRDAERAVAPYVGELAIACDSGEAVYRQALKMLGVKDIDDVHASALPAMLKMQPVPGQKKTTAPLLAADAAATDSYTKMFGTDGSRIGTA